MLFLALILLFGYFRFSASSAYVSPLKADWLESLLQALKESTHPADGITYRRKSSRTASESLKPP